MYLRNEVIQEKYFVGKHLAMSFVNDRTPELWKCFMPFRNEIHNRVSTDLISLQVYGADFDFNKSDPHMNFEKWALAEVSDLSSVTAGMEAFTLPSGLYAVFLHRGSVSEAFNTFKFIFTEWLPGSGFETDSRPHFEVLGDRYIHDSPLSEEEVWIPLRQKI